MQKRATNCEECLQQLQGPQNNYIHFQFQLLVPPLG